MLLRKCRNCTQNTVNLFHTSICLKSHTACMGSLPLTGVAGFLGFSWMIFLALLFKPSRWVLNSARCSFSSCGPEQLTLYCVYVKFPRSWKLSSLNRILGFYKSEELYYLIIINDVKNGKESKPCYELWMLNLKPGTRSVAAQQRRFCDVDWKLESSDPGLAKFSVLRAVHTDMFSFHVY